MPQSLKYLLYGPLRKRWPTSVLQHIRKGTHIGGYTLVNTAGELFGKYAPKHSKGSNYHLHSNVFHFLNNGEIINYMNINLLGIG